VILRVMNFEEWKLNVFYVYQANFSKIWRFGDEEDGGTAFRPKKLM